MDEPKLRPAGDAYALDCAVANRSDEQLLGLRFILLIVEPGGKLRARVTWNEESQIAPYSIRTFEFHPRLKDKVRSIDKLFLTIDEAVGRETIWHVVEGEKALRAFARGHHDVMPKVRSVANKFDPRVPPRIIPEEQE